MNNLTYYIKRKDRITRNSKANFPLQLEHKDESAVKFVITTCMDPWATSVGFLNDLAAIMRNSVLCAIGTVIPTTILMFRITRAFPRNNKDSLEI